MDTETPSQAIVKAANAVVIVTDVNGRQIGMRKLKTLDRMKLFELVGSDNAKNEQYYGYAALAFSVVSIDGEPVPRPGTKMQLEALVQRLDDEGFKAIADGFVEHFITADQSPDDVRDAVKNG